MAARYGGDEFAILFPDKGPHLETLQARLQEHLGAIFINVKNVSPTLSVGLARFPADGESVGELLSVSDTRMYIEKNAKK